MSRMDTVLAMLKYSLSSTLICIVVFSLYALLYRKGKRIAFEDIVLICVLVVTSSLRYDVGSDYLRYMGSASFASRRFADLGFLFSRDILIKYSFEVGYETLAVLTSRVFSSQYAIFWIISLILYIPIVIYCRKKTCNARAAIATFLFWGFWGLSLNIMKQAVAMVFILLAYECLKSKKIFFFILFAILAVSFHTTSFAAIVIILIVNIPFFRRFFEPNYRNLGIMIIAGIIFRLGTSIIVRIISRIGVFTKYISFLNADSTSRINRSFILYGALIETIFVIAIIYTAIKNIDRLKANNPEIEHIISIIMVGIPFSIIGISRTLWLSNRFAKFLFLFLIVLIPALYDDNNQRESRRGQIVLKKDHLFFWFAMVAWHAVYAVLMLDNNTFQIQTYLMK